MNGRTRRRIERHIAGTLCGAVLLWALASPDVQIPLIGLILLLLWAVTTTLTTSVLLVQKRRAR
jgi:hypothetical protein